MSFRCVWSDDRAYLLTASNYIAVPISQLNLDGAGAAPGSRARQTLDVKSGDQRPSCRGTYSRLSFFHSFHLERLCPPSSSLLSAFLKMSSNTTNPVPPNNPPTENQSATTPGPGGTVATQPGVDESSSGMCLSFYYVAFPNDLNISLQLRRGELTRPFKAMAGLPPLTPAPTRVLRVCDLSLIISVRSLLTMHLPL